MGMVLAGSSATPGRVVRREARAGGRHGPVPGRGGGLVGCGAATMGPVPPCTCLAASGRLLLALAAAPTGNAAELFAVVAVIYAVCLSVPAGVGEGDRR